MRPQSIQLFEKAFSVSLAISLIAVVLSWNQTVLQFDARIPGSGAALAATAVAISFGLFVLLWWLIARRASNFAKWVLVVLTAIGVFFFVSSLAAQTTPKSLDFAISALTNLLGVYAVWLLFKPDAATWLQSGGANEPDDPTTFD